MRLFGKYMKNCGEIKMPLVCDDCEKDKAIYQCNICKRFLCEVCAETDHICLVKWRDENYEEI